MQLELENEARFPHPSDEFLRKDVRVAGHGVFPDTTFIARTSDTSNAKRVGAQTLSMKRRCSGRIVVIAASSGSAQCRESRAIPIRGSLPGQGWSGNQRVGSRRNYGLMPLALHQLVEGKLGMQGLWDVWHWIGFRKLL